MERVQTETTNKVFVPGSHCDLPPLPHPDTAARTDSLAPPTILTSGESRPEQMEKAKSMGQHQVKKGPPPLPANYMKRMSSNPQVKNLTRPPPPPLPPRPSNLSLRFVDGSQVEGSPKSKPAPPLPPRPSKTTESSPKPSESFTVLRDVDGMASLLAKDLDREIEAQGKEKVQDPQERLGLAKNKLAEAKAKLKEYQSANTDKAIKKMQVEVQNKQVKEAERELNLAKSSVIVAKESPNVKKFKIEMARTEITYFSKLRTIKSNLDSGAITNEAAEAGIKKAEAERNQGLEGARSSLKQKVRPQVYEYTNNGVILSRLRLIKAQTDAHNKKIFQEADSLSKQPITQASKDRVSTLMKEQLQEFRQIEIQHNEVLKRQDNIQAALSKKEVLSEKEILKEANEASKIPVAVERDSLAYTMMSKYPNLLTREEACRELGCNPEALSVLERLEKLNQQIKKLEKSVKEADAKLEKLQKEGGEGVGNEIEKTKREIQNLKDKINNEKFTVQEAESSIKEVYKKEFSK